MEGIRYYYKMLFFQSCARRSEKYLGIESLASSAYWLISVLQGVNLISLLYMLHFFFDFLGKEGKWILFGVSTIPLLINYFIFMKNKKYKTILKQFSKKGVGKPNLKSYGLIIGFFTLTLLLLALAGKLYQSEYY